MTVAAAEAWKRSAEAEVADLRGWEGLGRAVILKAGIELCSTPQAGLYACVEGDPAWHHRSYSASGQTRSPSSHYRTMSLDEIRALPVGEVAARDCHLFMWTTQPHLEEAFSVLRAWGFRYSSVHTFWIKLNPKAADTLFMQPSDMSMGMGFTTRKNVELLILGRRGSPRRLVKNMPDILFAARRQHSRKPDASFSRIEAYCAGPRLEMFARETRAGWDVWGDEVTKFDERGVGRGPSQADRAPIYLGEPFGPPWPWPTTPLLEVA